MGSRYVLASTNDFNFLSVNSWYTVFFSFVHVSVKERVLILAGKHTWRFISFQRHHVLWKLGSEHLFSNEGIPARAAIRTIGSFRLLSMPPACGFCAGQLFLEVAPVVLDAKQKCDKNGGANSRVSEAQEKRDWNHVSHSVPLRIPNLSPIKTRNPAPAGNFNSRLPPPQLWAQIPNITAKICRMPHYVLLPKEGYIY